MLVLIRTILSPSDAIIILAKHGLSTDDPEIDARIKEIDRIEHAHIAQTLNEVMGKRVKDWEKLTPAAVQKRYIRAIKRLRGELGI